MKRPVKQLIINLTREGWNEACHREAENNGQGWCRNCWISVEVERQHGQSARTNGATIRTMGRAFVHDNISREAMYIFDNVNDIHKGYISQLLSPTHLFGQQAVLTR